MGTGAGIGDSKVSLTFSYKCELACNIKSSLVPILCYRKQRPSARPSHGAALAHTGACPPRRLGRSDLAADSESCRTLSIPPVAVFLVLSSCVPPVRHPAQTFYLSFFNKFTIESLAVSGGVTPDDITDHNACQIQLMGVKYGRKS